ncbi:hypothetical protein FAI40_04300 [Acetobacteraceae bacterium]|nr:hypothetical protein FAI40_04300 [Acetobacteraceae bacterium]
MEKGLRSKDFFKGLLVSAVGFAVYKYLRHRQETHALLSHCFKSLANAKKTATPLEDAPDMSILFLNFLTTQQPEVMAAFLKLIRISQTPLESYIAAFEHPVHRTKFKSILADISFMVFECSKIPEGEGKESAELFIRDAYVPRLLNDLSDLSHEIEAL